MVSTQIHFIKSGSLRLLVSHITLGLLITTLPGFAQTDSLARVTVPLASLRKHVSLLASDSLQGRLTGTTGQKQAAFYCLRSFRQHHLSPAFRTDSTHMSYLQTYPFTVYQVAPFGSFRNANGRIEVRTSNPSVPATYKRYELASPPHTKRDSSKVLFGHNVAGLLPGTDLKQQVIVLSAHYDHLGSQGKRIYHGADDNASGTAAILSVASVFDSLAQLGIRSRRSILFVLFSGEEGGLTGSRYFISNTPIPLRQLICDLNADMVGRIDDEHSKTPDYCYLLDGSADSLLSRFAEEANDQSVHLAINQGGYDVKTDPARYFSRSDQYNFARAGVPALFFTDGDHPDYHQPSDTADKINYSVLQKRATLLFQTAWRLANSALLRMP